MQIVELKNVPDGQPLVLRQPDTRYILRTNILREGTGIVVAAPDVVIEGDGVSVVNYGHSVGVPKPQWDAIRSQQCTQVPARLGMAGGMMMHFEHVTAPLTITSDPISITQAGVEYAATITPKVSLTGTTVNLAVLDVATGAVLTSEDSHGPASGFAILATWFARSLGAVALQVTITPPTGADVACDLGYDCIFRSREYGIVATPAFEALPTHLQALFPTLKDKKNLRSVENVTIRGLEVTCLSGMPATGFPIFAKAIRGLTVENVHSFANGIDASNISANFAADVTVTGGSCMSRVPLICNRKAVTGCIDLASNSGDIRIRDVQIDGSPQVGIIVSKSSASGSLRIEDNTIRQEALVTNAYGIMLSGVNNFVVWGNSITGHGRGISLDSWDGDVSTNGRIFENDVDISVGPNLEYGPASDILAAVALRMRNYTGAHRNIRIHDNQFTARTGPGLSNIAIGARIQQKNALGQMNDAGVRLYDNEFKAITEGGSTDKQAWALSLAGVDPGTGLELTDNRLESNHVCLQLGDDSNYNRDNGYTTLIRTTFAKSADGDARSDFTAIQAGDGRNSVHGVAVLDSAYEGGATDGIRPVWTAEKVIQFGTMAAKITSEWRQSGKAAGVMVGE